MLYDILRHNRMASLAENLEARGLIDDHDCDDVVVTASSGPWKIELTPDDDQEDECDSVDISNEPIVVQVWSDTQVESCIHVCKHGRHVANFLRKWCQDPDYRRTLNRD